MHKLKLESLAVESFEIAGFIIGSASAKIGVGQVGPNGQRG